MQTTHFTIWFGDAVNDTVHQGDDVAPAAAPVFGERCCREPGRGEDVDEEASTATQSLVKHKSHVTGPVWTRREGLSGAAASQGETRAEMSNHLTPFCM